MIYDKKTPDSEDLVSPDLYKKVIDSLSTPIFFRDLDGKYLMCNKAHNEYVKLTNDEIIGKTLYDVHTKEQADEYSRRDNHLLENPDKQTFEVSVDMENGDKRNLLINKVLIRDDNDKIIGIAGSINDVSELRKTKKQLEKAEKTTKVSSQMIHKISSGIIMVNDQFKVIDSNRSFATLMGQDILELYETIPGLRNADAEVLMPEVIFKMISNLLKSGEEYLDRDLKLQNKLLHVSAVTLYKNKVVGVLIRDMSAPLLVRDEIINRAERINKQNITTVQEIARLLGENASEIEELLYSIVESYRYGDEE